MRRRWRTNRSRRCSDGRCSPSDSRWRTTAVGGHDDPGAGQVGPPAQVQVVVQDVDAGVEAVDGGEEVAADQRAGAGHDEDVAHRVVLLLVELARFDQPDPFTRLVDRLPHLEDPSGVVEADELGADDAGVRPQRLPDHGGDGRRGRRCVVVEEAVEGGAVHDLSDVVGGRTESAVVVDAAHVGIGEHRRHPWGGVSVARRIDDEDGQVRVVLRRESGEAFVEPRSGVPGHHHGDDRRRRWTARGGRLHDCGRVLAESAPTRPPLDVALLRRDTFHTCVQRHAHPLSLSSNASRKDEHHGRDHPRRHPANRP